MRNSIAIVVSPGHRCDAQLAVAAARAGEVGILDLSFEPDPAVRSAAVLHLRRYANSDDRWGLRYDAGNDLTAALNALDESIESDCPLLVLSNVGSSTQELQDAIAGTRHLAKQIFLEVHELNTALAAEQVGFDGLILKGHEAGGRVGSESTFVLLQKVRGQTKLPYYVQGGIGPDTAAAALLAGAHGVVLCEELWLATESPLDRTERRQWAHVDGSETAIVGDANTQYRFFARADRKQVQEIDTAVVQDEDWEATVRDKLSSDPAELIAVGQGIAFASTLAERYTNVAGVLAAYRRRSAANVLAARQQQSLAPDSDLAKKHGTQYPILQGPMTRVSDVSSFCRSVADGGGLPFLALALMRGSEVGRLLGETKQSLGRLPWGVGILGFAPAELRAEQLAEIRQAAPPFAIVAGGRPSQAAALEEQGISTYLHVPSPGLLEAFINDGARKIILEGRECGGHVGPRSSFVLWQSAIDVLLDADVDDPGEFQIVFAGGIHDALSAAMVSALAAPLAERGMKIGVLLGTAYLFTPEAVTCGAITAEYQRQALECSKTVLLETGVGHATRCLETPFAVEFERTKRELVRAEKSPDEIRLALEMLNIGRLRLASKGLERTSEPGKRNGKGELVSCDEEEQQRRGMYMIGQVATLRDEPLPVAQLHEEVSAGSVRMLGKLKIRNRKKPARRRAGTPIAVVGMAGLFPDAPDLRRFWENIVSGHSAIGEVPCDRWQVGNYFDENRNAADRVYSKWGAFLPSVRFDALKWRIPPASLPSIDPMQLLSLQVAWDAMVDGGYDRREYARERTGAIFAVSGANERGGEYAVRTMMREYLPQLDGQTEESRARLLSELERILPEWTEDSFAGFLQNVIAGRIANRLDLGGPNFAVDAACASSMAAIQAAADQLRLGSCDMILVGAADGTNNPFGFMSFAKTHALSAEGRSRPFDDSTDGIVLGEGVAAAVLKRLPDAERDGDKIYATIKGVGASSDGLHRSMTAPYAAGQVRALRRAYEDAGVAASSVSLIEAHGTGTALGDRTELTALAEVFSNGSHHPQSVAVGSIKSMIGHTKATAGMASLLKATLALNQRLLPPTINVEQPNQEIDFTTGPCYVNSEARPWILAEQQQTRRAGISAFGFGGTNFHVVLEEYCGNYHKNNEFDWAPRSAEVFVWSDPDREKLAQRLQEFAERLQDAEDANLADLAAAHFNDTSNRRQSPSSCRLALVAESLEDLRKKLSRAADRLPKEGCFSDPSGIYCSDAAAVTPEEICFLYPGQGSQSVNMLRDLAVASGWSAAGFRGADEQTQGEFAQSLSRYIFPTPAFDDETRAQQREQLNDTQVAQPALAAVELFGTDLLARFGIRPGLVAGHSYGEYAALCAAGVFSRDDLLKHSVVRGRLSAEAARQGAGTMAAVAGPAEQVQTVLDAAKLDVHVANLNSQQQTIIAGPTDDVTTAIDKLADKGLSARRLPVTAAFHTPMMKEAAGKLDQHLSQSAFETPQLPVYNNTTAERHSDDSEEIRRLLVRHIAEPVRFEEQVRQMHRDGARVFFEVGPGRVLSNLVNRILDGKPHAALPLDSADTPGWTQLAHVIARAAALGIEIRLDGWFENRGLFEGPISEHLAELAAKRRPKATEWLVNPAKVRPALTAGLTGDANADEKPTRPADRPPAAAAKQVVAAAEAKPVLRSRPQKLPQAAQSPASRPPAAPPAANDSNITYSTTVSSHQSEPAMSSTEISHSGTPHENGNGHAQFAADLLPLVHSQLSQWMELQSSQQKVTERMLAMQEQMLMAAVQGHASLPPLIQSPPPVPRAEISRPTPFPVAPPASSNGAETTARHAAPVAAPSAPPRVIRKPPIPVPAAGEPVRPTVVATKEAPTDVAPRPAINTGAPETVVARDTQTNGQAPTPEEFRDALLQAISQRTGYPIDVLDENVPLEAGLGIDSIKKVEIFSNLKDYHKYFQDEDSNEEDVLEAFSQLKTLQDIVEYYASRRADYVGAAAKADSHSEGNGSAGKNEVRRMTLTAVESPLAAGNGKKKTSPKTI